jgi:hypothetical protein
MRTTRAVLALAALPLLAACSGGSGTSAEEPQLTAHPTPSSASPSGQVIRADIDAGTVDNGTPVAVKRGASVTLVLTAKAAGELHVHSTPEEHIEYPAGTSAVRLSFDTPGVIDIESHTLDKLIVRLEVR